MSAQRTTGATCPRSYPANLAAAVGALLMLSGCALTPSGTKDERDRLAETGTKYETPFEKRALPELADAPTWRDVLRRAFLANGDIEASYFQWKAAVERIDIASAYPNSDVSLGFDYMFSKESMKAFDRATFTAGFDSAMNLSLPMKVRQAGKVALDEARVAGEKFRVAKFELQRTVLRTWADYILQERVIAIRDEDLALRRMLAASAAGSASAGMRLRDAKEAEIELRMAESALLDLRSEHDTTRATLNAMMARDPHAPLQAPTAVTPPRELPDDDVMLAAAADIFPEVAAMAHEVEGRADALELARMRWIPDISPTLGITGSVSQALGAMITLPTTVVGIQGTIREAEAQLRSSQAVLRQRSADRVGEYVGLLVMYRNAARQAAFFESAILPGAERLSEDQTRAYEAGGATFADVIESRRALLDTRQMIASARAEMDKAVVEIECCLGVDIETLPAQSETPLPPVPRAVNQADASPSPAEENLHEH